MKRFKKEQIVKAVKIIDVAAGLNIKIESASTGNFTHRCCCPSDKHKSGSEKTGSLFIDSDNNNFYCFGCTASSNVIDFYILATGVDFSTAITALSEMVNEAVEVEPEGVKKPTNFDEILRISKVFKIVLRRYPDDAQWIESLMRKTDEFLDDIDRYDVQRAKALHEKIIKVVTGRYKKP